jgi:hypothetical protein
MFRRKAQPPAPAPAQAPLNGQAQDRPQEVRR